MVNTSELTFGNIGNRLNVYQLLGVFFCAFIGAGVISGLVTWSILRNRQLPKPPPEELQVAPLDWWQHCVLYQIYPRSFKDSDGDGVGDLQGIISKLEHFVDAGVDAIWLSPIFASPMVDFGYDISNFYEINEQYGSMDDFEQLLEKAHGLGLKVLLDFVPNHASTESDYFLKSETRDFDYEDFFVWADGLPDPNNESNRLPPSNWISLFGGSAWEWSDIREQYYLHQFSIEQADFNYRSLGVKEEMQNILRFWLEKGVDGFRVDAVPHLYEADPDDFEGRYPDNPLSGLSQFKSNQVGFTIPLYTKDLMEVYDVIYDWRELVDEYRYENGGDTRVLFTEGYSNITMTMMYYGKDDDLSGAHFPFNFGFITDLSSKSTAKDFVYVILKWLTYMPSGGVANWVFGNHDNSRMSSRFSTDMVDGLNSLSMMLPGVAVTYQGEEIGMNDGYVSWEDTLDVEACSRGDKDNYEKFSRDPARTPFQWDNSTSAGFSKHRSTWLPVAADYEDINLAKEKLDERSHFKVYQALTTLRKEATLTHGAYDIKALTDRTLYVVRSLPNHDTLVLLFNVSDDSDTAVLSNVKGFKFPATVHIVSVFSTLDTGDQIEDEDIVLEAGEAVVLRILAS